MRLEADYRKETFAHGSAQCGAHSDMGCPKGYTFAHGSAQCGAHSDIGCPQNYLLLYGDESGTTMAEVLVGFAFLMILMVSLMHMINVSSDFLMMTKDTVSEQEQFQEQLYKKVPDAEVVDVNLLEDVTLTFYEMEAEDTGEAFLRTGVSLKLERAEMKAWAGRRLDVTVYQVLYHGDETEQED